MSEHCENCANTTQLADRERASFNRSRDLLLAELAADRERIERLTRALVVSGGYMDHLHGCSIRSPDQSTVCVCGFEAADVENANALIPVPLSPPRHSSDPPDGAAP